MQACDIAGVDFVECREPVRVVALADHQPVAGFGVRMTPVVLAVVAIAMSAAFWFAKRVAATR